MEAYPKGKYVAAGDVCSRETLARLKKEIRAGAYFYIHFGLPCGSWSLTQSMNGGTRTEDRLGGDGSLGRENLGNEQSRNIV